MRRTGNCYNCGEGRGGNVFTVKQKSDWAWDQANRIAAYGFPSPKSELVKECNCCGAAMPFHPRKSAKRKRIEALAQELMDA